MSFGSDGVNQSPQINRTKIQKGEFSFFSDQESPSEDEDDVDESFYDSEEESISEDDNDDNRQLDTLEPPRYMKGNSYAIQKAHLINLQRLRMLEQRMKRRDINIARDGQDMVVLQRKLKKKRIEDKQLFGNNDVNNKAKKSPNQRRANNISPFSMHKTRKEKTPAKLMRFDIDKPTLDDQSVHKSGTIEIFTSYRSSAKPQPPLYQTQEDQRRRNLYGGEDNCVSSDLKKLAPVRGRRGQTMSTINISSVSKQIEL